MRIVYQNVAGIDVHKKIIAVAIIVLDQDNRWYQQTRTFGTMTADLLEMSDWLTSHGVTHVAMESTGEYWKPPFNILEENFTVILVNARQLSKVPGRKTDQSDAQWIAELMQHGLLKASFIPPPGQPGQSLAESAGKRQHQTGQRGQQCVGGVGKGDAGSFDCRAGQPGRDG